MREFSFYSDILEYILPLQKIEYKLKTKKRREKKDNANRKRLKKQIFCAYLLIGVI